MNELLSSSDYRKLLNYCSHINIPSFVDDSELKMMVARTLFALNEVPIDILSKDKKYILVWDTITSSLQWIDMMDKDTTIHLRLYVENIRTIDKFDFYFRTRLRTKLKDGTDMWLKINQTEDGTISSSSLLDCVTDATPFFITVIYDKDLFNRGKDIEWLILDEDMINNDITLTMNDKNIVMCSEDVTVTVTKDSENENFTTNLKKCSKNGNLLGVSDTIDCSDHSKFMIEKHHLSEGWYSLKKIPNNHSVNNHEEFDPKFHIAFFNEDMNQIGTQYSTSDKICNQNIPGQTKYIGFNNCSKVIIKASIYAKNGIDIVKEWDLLNENIIPEDEKYILTTNKIYNKINILKLFITQNGVTNVEQLVFDAFLKDDEKYSINYHSNKYISLSDTNNTIILSDIPMYFRFFPSKNNNGYNIGTHIRESSDSSDFKWVFLTTSNTDIIGTWVPNVSNRMFITSWIINPCIRNTTTVFNQQNDDSPGSGANDASPCIANDIGIIMWRADINDHTLMYKHIVPTQYPNEKELVFSVCNEEQDSIDTYIYAKELTESSSSLEEFIQIEQMSNEELKQVGEEQKSDIENNPDKCVEINNILCPSIPETPLNTLFLLNNNVSCHRNSCTKLSNWEDVDLNKYEWKTFDNIEVENFEDDTVMEIQERNPFNMKKRCIFLGEKEGFKQIIENTDTPGIYTLVKNNYIQSNNGTTKYKLHIFEKKNIYAVSKYKTLFDLKENNNNKNITISLSTKEKINTHFLLKYSVFISLFAVISFGCVYRAYKKERINIKIWIFITIVTLLILITLSSLTNVPFTIVL